MSAAPPGTGSDGEGKPAPLNLDPDMLVLLGQFRGQKQAHEFSLVLRALEIPHELRPSNVGFSLVVMNTHFEAAQQELMLYRSENVDWPPKDVPVKAGALWIHATIVYAALILIVFLFQRGDAFDTNWSSAGRVDGLLMRSGEWLRSVTALTLHADLVHLASNMTYGALFGALVAYGLGGGIGWLAILMGGVLGNVINIFVQNPEHRSIGASTAVFAAVGVLAGSEVVRRHLLQQRRIRRAAPILVAFLLLSYLGMGGAEHRDQTTDVSAHVTGLLAGFAIGAPLGRLPIHLTQDRRTQLLAGGAALAILGASWLVQL
ncbi:MAG: rhomboid protease GluP [Planctomycetota bacterium]